MALESVVDNTKGHEIPDKAKQQKSSGTDLAWSSIVVQMGKKYGAFRTKLVFAISIQEKFNFAYSLIFLLLSTGLLLFSTSIHRLTRLLISLYLH